MSYIKCYFIMCVGTDSNGNNDQLRKSALFIANCLKRKCLELLRKLLYVNKRKAICLYSE